MIGPQVVWERFEWSPSGHPKKWVSFPGSFCLGCGNARPYKFKLLLISTITSFIAHTYSGKETIPIVGNFNASFWWLPCLGVLARPPLDGRQ